MGTHPEPLARITLDQAFTAVRHALAQEREAGYRIGRSISPTATDSDIDVAAEASRQASELTTAAWRALYSAVASHTWRVEDQPIPFHLTEAAEDLDLDAHSHVDIGNGPYCLDCDQAAAFCPVGAK